MGNGKGNAVDAFAPNGLVNGNMVLDTDCIVDDDKVVESVVDSVDELGVDSPLI